MTEPKDALTLARQMSCGKHPDSIIKHASDSVPRCPHCGVSAADWEQMQMELAPIPSKPQQAINYPWGYNFPQGGAPYPGSGNNSSNP